jgi:hypothetical protein
MIYGQLAIADSRNAFILISILLICIYAISKAVFPKVFSDLIAPNKLFGLKVREDLGSNLRPFSSEHLYFAGLNSLNISFVMLYLANSLLTIDQLPTILIIDNSALGILQWIGLGFALNLITYVKFLLIFCFGSLFDMRAIISRHFVDMINTSLLFFLFMVLYLCSASFSSIIPNTYLLEIAVGLTLIFYYYRSLLIYLRLLGEREHSKLYIFSYICATELAPLTIGLVLIVTSQI